MSAPLGMYRSSVNMHNELIKIKSARNGLKNMFPAAVAHESGKPQRMSIGHAMSVTNSCSSQNVIRYVKIFLYIRIVYALFYFL